MIASNDSGASGGEVVEKQPHVLPLIKERRTEEFARLPDFDGGEGTNEGEKGAFFHGERI